MLYNFSYKYDDEGNLVENHDSFSMTNTKILEKDDCNRAKKVQVELTGSNVFNSIQEVNYKNNFENTIDSEQITLNKGGRKIWLKTKQLNYF